MPRIVLLTTGTRHAARILDALARRDICPDTVILESPRGAAIATRIGDAWRRRGPRDTLAAIGRRLVGRVRPATEPWRRAAYYEPRASEVVTVASLDGQEARDALERARPDLLVLAGAPILPSEVLEVPRIGTLNAHPGILPRFRGVDVVAHAVLAGGPIGAAVHWVDAGIDTGRVVDTVEVQPAPGDDLRRLQERVEEAGGEALAQTIARLATGEMLPEQTQGERFPLCRRLSAADRQRAEARLRERA